MMRLEELGRTIAEVQDADRALLGASEEAGQSFIRALRRPQERAKQPWLLAAAVFSLAAAIGVLFWPKPHVPGLEVARNSAISVGKSITVPKDRDIPLTFSDGSSVLLSAGTKANVKSLTAEGATVAIEEGRAKVAVIHRPSTHWSIHAGPYSVAVTGTQFAVSWLPESERFELTLNEGSVVVTTFHNSHAAVTMTAPERLVIEQGRWRLSPTLAEPSEAASNNSPAPEHSADKRPSSTAMSPEGALPDAAKEASASRTVLNPRLAADVARTERAGASTSSDWLHLSKLGRYGEAYAKASDLGLRSLADESSAQTLLTLAEVCRFAGHGSEAMLVLTKLRQRFSGTAEAAIAAFQLGRLSSDGQLAASWFRSYLREQPSGSLAREASGRLIEGLDRSGDRSGARAAAQNYLQRYPSGPHAKFARDLLNP